MQRPKQPPRELGSVGLGWLLQSPLCVPPAGHPSASPTCFPEHSMPARPPARPVAVLRTWGLIECGVLGLPEQVSPAKGA